MPDVGVDLVRGADGLLRCGWGASADYADYHDGEWGLAVHGDDALFERISLEAFQSGLAWITILRKRPAFRAAFAGFAIESVADFDEHDRARLLEDADIVRNRAKIDATLRNARTARDVLRAEGPGALDALVWSFAPTPRSDRDRPRMLAQVPALTPESTALAKELKARGFVFVGPTTAYALMQACGLVDDHLAGCHRAV